MRRNEKHNGLRERERERERERGRERERERESAIFFCLFLTDLSDGPTWTDADGAPFMMRIAAAAFSDESAKR